MGCCLACLGLPFLALDGLRYCQLEAEHPPHDPGLVRLPHCLEQGLGLAAPDLQHSGQSPVAHEVLDHFQLSIALTIYATRYNTQPGKGVKKICSMMNPSLDLHHCAGVVL